MKKTGVQSQNPTTPLPVRPQMVAKFKVLKFFLHFSSVWSQSTPEQAVKNEARWQHSRSMQKNLNAYSSMHYCMAYDHEKCTECTKCTVAKAVCMHLKEEGSWAVKAPVRNTENACLLFQQRE